MGRQVTVVGTTTVETGLTTVLMENESATKRSLMSAKLAIGRKRQDVLVRVAAAASWTVVNCVVVAGTVSEKERER